MFSGSSVPLVEVLKVEHSTADKTGSRLRPHRTERACVQRTFMRLGVLLCVSGSTALGV